MSTRDRPVLTLARQMLLLQMAVVVGVLAVVAVVSLRQSTMEFSDQQGSRMRSVAEYLSNLDVVRDESTSDFAPEVLAPAVDRALNLSGATVVTIARPDGRIIASSDPSRIGEQAVLGNSRVTEGRGWTGNLEVDGRKVVAGHAPILSDDGELVALSLAQQDYPSVWDRFADASTDLALFLGIGALFGAAGSVLLARFIKRRTRGLAPHEIATLAEHREALLHSIREGVVAVDPNGRVTMANDGALDLLGLDGQIVGRQVDQLGLDDAVAEALRSPDELRDAVLLVGERVLVLNQRAASSRGEGIGTVTTMRDRTELTALQSRLTSTISVTDALRAQTHEFANQLHTISGLVQLEEYQEVRTLVGTLTEHRAAQTDFVTKRFADRAVAALLIAKSSVAGEAGIDLRIDPESSLPQLDPDLSADLTTIVGNLVDNGFDAVRDHAGGWVSLQAASTHEAVELIVSDDGDGVPPHLRDAIFVRGVSTKPDVPGGRGIGLPLVRLLCTQRGGTVTVDDRPGGGAVFRVVLPARRAGPHFHREQIMRDVLVVDDDFMVARIHARFVDLTEGFVVCGAARTGAEALEMAADLQPDLVLLDVHLPDMSGIEVLDGLRESGSTAGVIMVTAESDADVVRQALRGGALQYVVKPFEQADLATRLDQVAAALDSLGSGNVDQATIDRAFGSAGGSPQAASPLPKGLSAETADLVRDTLGEHEDISASECGEAVGVSRVTARRYLEYFVAHDRAVVRLRYGVAGRPERRYSRP